MYLWKRICLLYFLKTIAGLNGAAIPSSCSTSEKSHHGAESKGWAHLHHLGIIQPFAQHLLDKLEDLLQHHYHLQTQEEDAPTTTVTHWRRTW